MWVGAIPSTNTGWVENGLRAATLLLLFPLSAVLLNCPYPDSPVFAFFFPFSSGGGATDRPRGNFVAGHSQTITVALLFF